MRRRTLLARAGTALGAATVAGCLADDEPTSAGGDGDGTTTTDDGESTPDDSTTTEGSTPDPVEDPVATVTVGDRDPVAFPDNNRPHVVDFENASDAERSMTVAVQRSETAVEEFLEAVPSGGYVRLILAVPGRYTLDVAVDGEDRGTVTVERSRFDCNSSTTTVTVPASGDLDSVTESTEEACHEPEVADATVESGEGECSGGEDDRATPSIEGEAVLIDGTLVTATPCHRATLADASVADRTLTVVVAATSPDEACVDCVGAVPYDATVEMDYDHPDEARVVHRGPHGERTVSRSTL